MYLINSFTMFFLSFIPSFYFFNFPPFYHTFLKNRVQAGLLKENEKKETKKIGPETDKQKRSQVHKSREKSRRGTRKEKRNEALNEEKNCNEGGDIIDNRLQSEIEKRQERKNDRRKFSHRMSDLAQLSVGCDILACSSSSGGGGVVEGRNFICLDMMGLAGESSLKIEARKKNCTTTSTTSAITTIATTTAPKNNGDNNGGNGNNVNDVDINGSSSMTTHEEDDRDGKENNKKRLKTKAASSGIGFLHAPKNQGVSSFEFDCSVPRMVWTHIAMVATKTPKNRVTLYMVSGRLGE